MDALNLIPGNRWDLVEPLPDAPPQLSVSVVIPTRDGGDNLVRTLDALSLSTYPAHLLEAVVADDLSDPPLRLPEQINGMRVRCVRTNDHDVFGAGMARNLGAASSTADVLIFLDADMICSRHLVAAHMRWHHAVSFAVVTGVLGFVDTDDIDDVALRQAVATDSMESLLSGRELQGQVWRDRHFIRSRDYSVDAPDLFRSSIGALISVSRSLFERVGGFRELGVRGVEDTEFGYRLHTTGGLFVVDRTAPLWHQGRRTLDTNRQKQIREDRRSYVEDLMPVEDFRPEDLGRVAQVPRVGIELLTNDPAGLAATARRLAPRPRADLQVWSPLATDLSDPRLRPITEVDPVDLGAIPFRCRVAPGWSVGPETADRLSEWFTSFPVGVFHLLDLETGHEVATAWSARALGRAHLSGHNEQDAALAAAGSAFGERWTSLAEAAIEKLD